MAKLKDINNTDIRDAIRLGCRTMGNVFNADDNDMPFFGAHLRPHPPALAWSEFHAESHIPGRHLNALLAAEGVAGVEIDEQAVEKHTRAAFLTYSGPVPLPLNRETTGRRTNQADFAQRPRGISCAACSRALPRLQSCQRTCRG